MWLLINHKTQTSCLLPGFFLAQETHLGGSPGHMERPCVGVPAESPAKIPATSHNQLPIMQVNELQVASAPDTDLHWVTNSRVKQDQLGVLVKMQILITHPPNLLAQNHEACALLWHPRASKLSPEHTWWILPTQVTWFRGIDPNVLHFLLLLSWVPTSHLQN